MKTGRRQLGAQKRGSTKIDKAFLLIVASAKIRLYRLLRKSNNQKKK